MKFFFKKSLLKALESRKRIGSLKHLRQTEPVLILGDGISTIHAADYMKNYKNIICCNSSILNKSLHLFDPLFYILVDPYFLVPRLHQRKDQKDLNDILRDSFRLFPRTVPVMHSLGRPFNIAGWADTNPIFISPYHSARISSGEIYDDFTSSLQASLGMALISGFKEIHLAGFDAWLLNPKNNLRWHSKCSSPEMMDHESSELPSKFILDIARQCELSVYCYEHYTSRFDFIREIKIETTKIYIPEYHRSEYINSDQLIRWVDWENRVHPMGYAVKK